MGIYYIFKHNIMLKAYRMLRHVRPACTSEHFQRVDDAGIFAGTQTFQGGCAPGMHVFKS